MLDVPKNTACTASDGFEFDSNPGNNDLPKGFMIRFIFNPNTFFSDDTNTNLYPPSKKTKTSWSNFEEKVCFFLFLWI